MFFYTFHNISINKFIEIKKFKNIYPSTISGLIHNLDEIYVEKGVK